MKEQKRKIVEIRTSNNSIKKNILKTIFEMVRIGCVGDDFVFQIDEESEICNKIIKELINNYQLDKIEYTVLDEFSQEYRLKELLVKNMNSDEKLEAIQDKQDSKETKQEVQKQVLPETKKEETKQEVQKQVLPVLKKEEIKPKEIKVFKSNEKESISRKQSNLAIEENINKAHIIFKRGWKIDAKELSENLEISFEEAEKILLRLKKEGIIESNGKFYQLISNSNVHPEKAVKVNIFQDERCKPIIDFIMDKARVDKTVLNKKFPNDIVAEVVNSLEGKHIVKQVNSLIASYRIFAKSRIIYVIKNNPGITEEGISEILKDIKQKDIQDNLYIAIKQGEIQEKDKTKYYLIKDM